MMNHNKYNFNVGDMVIVDEFFANSSEVVITKISEYGMFSFVKADDGYEWETMTSRLTPLIIKNT